MKLSPQKKYLIDLYSNGEWKCSIPLTRGKQVIVDDEDYEILSKHKWYASKNKRGNGYVYYAARTDMESRKVVYMHRTIMNASVGTQVDHINHNTLDNSRTNLRLASPAQNNWNSQRPVTNTSGYKGVSWKKRAKLWEAYLNLNNRKKHIGYFHSKEDAALSYNDEAKKTFGAFANLNIV